MANSKNQRDMKILSGNSHPELSKLICRHLGRNVDPVIVNKFANLETKVEIVDSIRHKEVYIVQTGGTENVNDCIMELLIMAYACKKSSARKVIGIVPYMPYARQCRVRKRGSIVSKLVAEMMVKAGLTHILTVDLHQKEIQGFFSVPVDNLRASPFLVEYIRREISNYTNGVIVARKPSAVQRATSFAESLKIGLAIIQGDVTDTEETDGRCSPPLFGVHENNNHVPGAILVGDVSQRNVVIFDDILDNGQVLKSTSKLLKSNGALKVYAVATHGMFSEQDVADVAGSEVDRVITTNTLPELPCERRCSKFHRIDISSLLSESMRRVYHGESMSFLFKKVPLAD